VSDDLPRLYTDLSAWYQLLTAPEDYDEEAAFYVHAMSAALGRLPGTLLELGSGSGNNAWHFKHRVAHVTLTDLSADMLAISQTSNPECEHVQGDMRSLRLDREFDAVFVHDAVCYLLTEDDLRQAMHTAFVHCRPDGVALFAPDHVRELFPSGGSTEQGGHDGAGRALRYVEWTSDPDPQDTTYFSEFAYLLHEDGQPTRCVYDRHVCGLFAREVWLRTLEDVGFVNIQVLPLVHSEVPAGSVEAFVARKPDSLLAR
jgi:SAM-dependent methyltransferase